MLHLNRLVSAAAGVSLLTAPWPAQAQLVPDTTLGPESSLVTPGVPLREAVVDLIEGGALRGSNLFHSFLEFNVDAGQRVYFANPAGIESILSRITGGNPSAIFGTLGVDGAADLFLINPNGLVFGETATLDIQGSFYASTAEAISLGEGVYSAAAPDQSSLLTVRPSALFSSYLSEASGNIQSRGQLAAQENMTLAANNLDLQGQVAAGGDLTLLGLDTVQIRDAVDRPFVAFAGGDLLVQGNEQVNIVALSHADSGLYSYGDMVLRSANPVGGDAHYWSGGSFRIENLDGSIGDLFSPVDPIIRTLNDVVINEYRGSSLHILAGGSVTMGTAQINAPDAGSLGVDFLQETLVLSDGTVVNVDGGARPTLDIRAGVAPEALGTPPLALLTGFNNNTTDEFRGAAFVTGAPSGADITVGDVFVDAPNGLVLLTNQYQPNTNLVGGSIFVTGDGIYRNGINAGGSGRQGGAVYLDARNDVLVTNSSIVTIGAGVVGDVVINAGDTVRFERQDRLTGVASIAASAMGTGGDIRIQATTVELSGGAQLVASTFGNGDAGHVVITARDRVTFNGTSADGQFVSGADSSVSTEATGNGGNVVIDTGTLEVLNGALLLASTFGSGNAGNIEITARDRVTFNGTSADGQFSSAAFSSVEAGATGTGGNVAIDTGTLEVLNGAALAASTLGNGDAGNVVITARDRVTFDGGDAFSSVEFGATGNGGNVVIDTGTLEVLNGAGLLTNTLGNGDTGNVEITARDRVTFDSGNAFSSVEFGATGTGGNVVIDAGSLEVFNGAQLVASTFGNGDAGNVVITVRDRVTFDSTADSQFSSAAFSRVNAGATGNGGNVVIDAGSLEVFNGAQLVASTFGNGDAGNVVITARDRVTFNGTSTDGQFSSAASSRVNTGATGNGGNVVIDAGRLEVFNGAQLVASTFGNGDAGNVVITARDRVTFNGTSTDGQFSSAASSRVNTGATGNGGNVVIDTGTLEVLNGAGLVANTRGNGDAGNVNITARSRVTFNGTSTDGQFVSGAASSVNTGAMGNGGNVVIDTGTLEVLDGAQLLASTSGNGDAGNVNITAHDRVTFDDTSTDGQFSSAAFSRVNTGATGNGGNVVIDTGTLEVLNGAGLLANTLGNGDAGNVVITARKRVTFDGTSADGQFRSAAFSSVGAEATGNGGNVVIDAGSLEVLNGAQLVASTRGDGDAGNVVITAREQVNLQGASTRGAPSGILTNNVNSSTGQSRDIRVISPVLRVQDGAVLLATTSNDQAGGNIILSLVRLEILDGGQVVTGSVGNGPAGTIQVDATDGIVIQGFDPNFATRIEQIPDIAVVAIPQSALSVRSSGGGAAGNILIGQLGTTPRLELNNGGQIIAESASVDGGNIVVNLNNVLLLRNGSLISTTAGSAQAGGDGGNITITVPFIVAIPAENSDIAADAFQGAGGNVNITARGIFGIRPRPERTSLSDITASSELGVSGTIALDTLDVSFIDNSLTSLADAIVDTAALTAGSCIARTDETLGAFTVTGSDGLPQRPGDSGISSYPTGTVRATAAPTATLQEPNGVYQLPDGRLVLSHACE